MSIITAKWTVTEYHQLVKVGALACKSVELLQGDIVQMTPEGPFHSNRIRQTSKVLRQQISSDYEVSETHPITLSHSEPEPDITVVSANNYDDRHPHASEIIWVLEFAHSSLEKDLEEKRLVYAQAEIPEYWVVNLRDHHVIVFRSPNNGEYHSRQVMTEGVIAPQSCEGVSLPIDILIGTR